MYKISFMDDYLLTKIMMKW